MGLINSFSKPYGDGVIMSFGFFLEKEQEGTIIQMSEKIAKTESIRYVHNHDNRRPFLRLYEAVFPQKNIPLVYKQAAKVISLQSPVLLKWAELEETQNCVILFGQDNQEVRTFQLTLINEINSLRVGYYKKKYLSSTKFSNPDEQESIKHWGWPFVTDYEPYVVLVRAKTKFNLLNFELEWDYKECYLSKFMMGTKNNPGMITQQKVFNLDLNRSLKNASNQR